MDVCRLTLGICYPEPVPWNKNFGQGLGINATSDFLQGTDYTLRALSRLWLYRHPPGNPNRSTSIVYFFALQTIK